MMVATAASVCCRRNLRSRQQTACRNGCSAMELVRPNPPAIARWRWPILTVTNLRMCW
ncbi:MAG: hypothetical protein ACK55Z_25960 [bacterium]